MRKETLTLVLAACALTAFSEVRYLWNWRGHGRLKNSVGLPLAPIPPTGKLAAIMKP